MMNPEGGAMPIGHQHGDSQIKQEMDMSDMEHKDNKN
jgi:hypothetical protein